MKKYYLIESLSNDGYTITTQKLRSYEKHKLIKPIVKPSGHREYSKNHINEIKQIMLLLMLGYRLSQIKSGQCIGVKDRANVFKEAHKILET